MHYSDLVNVGEFHSVWKETMMEMHKKYANDDSEVDMTDLFEEPVFPEVPADVLEEIRSTCGMESLDCAGESEDYEFVHRKLASGSRIIPNIDATVDLETLKIQERRLSKIWRDPGIRKQAIKFNKHSNAETLLQYYWEDDEEVDELMADDDVILSVLVCRSANPDKTDLKRALCLGGIKYLVLGSQFLTDLRDKIACPVDFNIPGDFSENPTSINETTQRAKDLYKSGLFFINGIFYNDMRHPTCIDYSEIIKEWQASDGTRGLETIYQSRNMEGVRFKDLSLKIGFVYLFMHQGNCEHLVVFTDLRIPSKGDCKDRLKYPMVLSSKTKKKTLCMICHLFSAKWLTENNPRLPAYRFLFCDKCFMEFNYDQGGCKIGSFTAKSYIDDVATL